MRFAGAAVLLALLSPAGVLAQAAVPVELAVTGRVAHPRTLGLPDLQALPPVTVDVSHVTGQGVQTGSFTGALLWTLLEAASPEDASGPRSHLQHTLLARGRDGYAVALAIGEVDPQFEGKQVLVAYAQDGKPLPGLRLVVPLDARAGRGVRDLVGIEVR